MTSVACLPSRSLGAATRTGASRIPLGLGRGLGLLILAAGCSSGGQVARTDEVKASAVAIEAEGCSLRPAVASGAVVESPGLVLTVAHAVAGSNRITVIDHEGTRFPATLRFLDPASDIALLEVDALTAAPLPISIIEPPTDGQLLVRNGADGIESRPVTVTKRLTVTIEDIYIEADVERTAFEFEGEVTAGDSGGMVVVDGSVAAMVYARARNADRGFALDERELNDALGEPDTRSDPELGISSGDCVP